MSHAQFDGMMQSLASTFAGDVDGFLSALSPIHVRWHARRGVVIGGALQPVGFLTFHHSVVQAYKRELRSVSSRLPAPWGPGYNPAIDGATDPVDFSDRIERWHNGVHNSDMTLMNPATNIWRPRFWALHNFIDKKFTAWQKAHRKITAAEHATV